MRKFPVVPRGTKIFDQSEFSILPLFLNFGARAGCKRRSSKVCCVFLGCVRVRGVFWFVRYALSFLRACALALLIVLQLFLFFSFLYFVVCCFCFCLLFLLCFFFLLYFVAVVLVLVLLFAGATVFLLFATIFCCTVGAGCYCCCYC